MNKFIKTAALATLVTVGPLSMGVANAQTRRDVRNERQDVRDARRDLREERRDLRQAQRWNQRQHNGYYMNGRWYYGAPSAAIQSRRDYRPGYAQWRRGDRLPANYRGYYHDVDWRREHLRAPPGGYHYVRTDRGETLLVGIATGVILGLILSN